MNKYLFALITVFFSVTNSFAQELRLGHEVGLNLINLNKPDLGSNYAVCWSGGVHSTYSFTDYFSLRSGILVSQRKKYYESADTSQLPLIGFDPSSLGIPGVDFSVYSTTTVVKTQLGIEIPIMASYNYKGLSIFAGPYVNMMVGAWSKELTKTTIPLLKAIDIDSLDPSGTIGAFLPPAENEIFVESSSKSNLRFFDYGFKGGVSFTGDNFTTSVMYNYGLPDYRISKGTDDKSSHQYFSVNVAYTFKIWPKNSSSSFGD